MTAKNRITINLEDSEYVALQKIARRTDRSLAWLGRKAICELLEKTNGANENTPENRPDTISPERHGLR